MIHVAGSMFAGLQVCTRCGEILTDYRDAMIPDGQPALGGWAIGAFVEVGGTNPKCYWRTTDLPNCEPKGLKH